MISADKGKQVGGNLFHSFKDFGLTSAESASFQGPASVQNILARVTGGSASSIDGTIRSEIVGANLFLINPAGVMFGPNAKLDVSGSFTVSTADYVRLADGGKFNAHLNGDDVLTAAPASAFGFLAATPQKPLPAPVTIQGSALNPAVGKSFSVIAGDVTIDGGQIVGTDSRVNIISVRSAGEVAFSGSEPPVASIDSYPQERLGVVNLKTGAIIDTSGVVGGRVMIRGGKLVMEGSASISSQTFGSANGEGVTIAMRESLEISGSKDEFTFISTNTSGQGKGGDIELSAADVDIAGTFISAKTSSLEEGAGDAGSIKFSASNFLALGFGSDISTFALGRGKGGDIELSAANMSIGFAVISAGASPLDDSTANAGSIKLSASGFLALLASDISTFALGQGKGGDIELSAADMRIAGAFISTETPNFVSPFDGVGEAGSIKMSASGLLELSDSRIFTRITFGRKGGDIELSAANMFIRGAFISAETFSFFLEEGVGDAGNIKLSASGLLELDGFISTSTAGLGKGGDIELSAAGMYINAFISAETFFEEEGAGDAGSIKLSASNFLALGSGRDISTNTFGRGKGGDIELSAANIYILDASISADSSSLEEGAGDAGGIKMNASGLLEINGNSIISTATGGPGRGGTVELTTQDLRIAGGRISADTISLEEGAGDAGDIKLTATGLLEISDGGSVSTDTSGHGNGGNIVIFADRLAMASEAEVSTDTSDAGDGGTITITAQQELTITGVPGGESFTGISANSGSEDELNATGKAGDVVLTTPRLVLTAGEITADTYGSGEGGTVTVTASNLLMTEESTITAVTFGEGKGGDVSVTASDTLRIIGNRNSEFETGIFATSREDATGKGGNVNVRAGDLRITETGEISADTFGAGIGGAVRVFARAITIAGDSHSFTGIAADSNAPGNSGRSGNVTVTADQITLRDGGQISAATAGTGAGGNVRVNARHLTIDGKAGKFASGIFADSKALGKGGPGGSIALKADAMALTKGGSIAARSTNSGNSGSITLHSKRLSLDQGASIQALSTGNGLAGNIMLSVREPLRLSRNSLITSSSTLGSAGQIDILSGSSLLLDESTITVQALAGNAGTISVTAPEVLSLDSSSIVAQAGLNGGNIVLNPGFLALRDGSRINANAARGAGGQITINIPAADAVLGGADDFFIVSPFVEQSADSLISASSQAGVPGALLIAAPEVDLSSGLSGLSAALLDASTQLGERCTAMMQGEFSSFVVQGRGGIAPEPDEVQVSVQAEPPERKQKKALATRKQQ